MEVPAAAGVTRRAGRDQSFPAVLADGGEEVPAVGEGEQRRERQAQGIEKARLEGKYKGRPKNMEKRRRVADLLEAGFSVRKAANIANASTYMVQDVRNKGA